MNAKIKSTTTRAIVDALALLPALFLVACTPALNWRDISPANAQGLKMVFPCKPTAQTRQVEIPGLVGGPVSMHVLTCNADGVVWALSYFDAATPARWHSGLSTWQDALLQNLGVVTPAQQPVVQGKEADRRMGLAPWLPPGGTPHPDANTWWAQGARPVSLEESEPVGVRVWHFSRGLWVFQASVWATTLQPDDPRWLSFANGIHFPP